MPEQNELAAINAGEEVVPRLANKVFYTETTVTTFNTENQARTMLCFNDDGSSELWESNDLQEKTNLVGCFCDPNGPSLEAISDTIEAHVAGIIPGVRILSAEDVYKMSTDIAANY